MERRKTRRWPDSPAIIDMYSSYMEVELTYIGGYIMDRYKAVETGIRQGPSGSY